MKQFPKYHQKTKQTVIVIAKQIINSHFFCSCQTNKKIEDNKKSNNSFFHFWFEFQHQIEFSFFMFGLVISFRSFCLHSASAEFQTTHPT